MFRTLYLLLTLVSAVVFAGVVVLWARSKEHRDAVVFRVAPSYAGWPRVKWVVIRGGDGLHLSALLKVVPHVNKPSPPWRRDLTLGTEAPAMNMDGMPVRVISLTAPRPTFGRSMTEAQHSEFDALVEPVYGSVRRLQWGAGTVSPFGPTRVRGNPLLERLGGLVVRAGLLPHR
jgi:hypothetical protein